ncbi:MAG: hypothetical protein ACTFAK_09930 [Candidatus Electronema sp. VV]
MQQWDTERHLRDFPGLMAKIESWTKAEILRKVAVEMQTGGSKAANLIQEDKLLQQPLARNCCTIIHAMRRKFWSNNCGSAISSSAFSAATATALFTAPFWNIFVRLNTCISLRRNAA